MILNAPGYWVHPSLIVIIVIFYSRFNFTFDKLNLYNALIEWYTYIVQRSELVVSLLVKVPLAQCSYSIYNI